LNQHGLHAALGFLNGRVHFRFTGVFSFDGPMLRNVCLFDREGPHQRRGDDAPVSQTYCGITGSGGDCLEIGDGRVDSRFPWMQANAVIAYCGVPVFEPHGDVIGTLCHSDLRPCQVPKPELPTLRAAASLVWTFCLAARHGAS
jgi:hypothetical protein